MNPAVAAAARHAVIREYSHRAATPGRFRTNYVMSGQVKRTHGPTVQKLRLQTALRPAPGIKWQLVVIRQYMCETADRSQLRGLRTTQYPCACLNTGRVVA